MFANTQTTNLMFVGRKNIYSNTRRNVVQTNPPLRWCRVAVHCRRDCHPQSDCRRDCSSGGTRLTWVTVAISTQPGDRLRVGLPWVAVFGLRVWVLGGGLQTGWRPWVAQCTKEGGHRMWVFRTLVGCDGTQQGCQWHPRGICVLVISSPFPCWACTLARWLPPKHTPISVGDLVFAHLGGIVPHIHTWEVWFIFVGLDHNGRCRLWIVMGYKMIHWPISPYIGLGILGGDKFESYGDLWVTNCVSG